MNAADADTIFSRRFMAGFAVYLITCAMAYIGCATFLDIPQGNQRVVDGVLGFIMGTVITLPLTFYFSTSKSAQNKDATIASMIPAPPVAPTPAVPPVVRIDDTAAPVKVQETSPT